MKQFIVDAFTDKIFGGNPAAVCILENFPDESLMQKIAMENNFSETAFLVKEKNFYKLRWFTPAAEIDFCGHATLASSFVILTQIEPNLNFVEFETRRGKLSVTKVDKFFEMDFPAYEYKKIPVTAEMQAAIGAEIFEAYLSRDLLLVVKDAETVEKLQPNFEKILKLEGTTQAVTAAGKNFDCVSRVFAPKVGVNEDPVTGSTHCLIAPYWAEKLGKKKILARQASTRGGILHCKICGERVKISGQAVLFATSKLNLEEELKMNILAAVAVPHPPIILPEVGRGEEEKISATSNAYKEISRRIVELNPDTIIITSPHSIMYADYFHISPGEFAEGNMGRFRAPQVDLKINYDVEFVDALSNAAMAENIPAGKMGERDKTLDHGTLIPVRFLEQAGLDFDKVKFLRIGLSGLSAAVHYKFGQTISKVAEDLNRRVVFVASGDLSHKLKSDGPYGFVEEGPQFDKAVMENLGGADFLKLLTMDNTICNRAAECGLRSFWIMAGALDRKNISAEKLSYEGPFGVGYGVVWFNVGGENLNRNFDVQLENFQHADYIERKKNEDAFVKLARLSLETFVKTHKPAELPKDLPAEMINRRAGTFVSLHKGGNLRGCIGTFLPTTNSIAEEILQNAISACSRDPRFSPVEVSELEEIEISVDVLSEPERIFDIKDCDAKKYGVIVENGGRRGLLLPDLEGVNTPQEQIAIAKKKAGIPANEKVALWRFEVIRHH